MICVQPIPAIQPRLPAGDALAGAPARAATTAWHPAGSHRA